MNMKLQAAIAELATHQFIDESGRIFPAITQSDLMAALREKGWSLPAAGFFLSEVERLGFEVKQGYQFGTKVRRHYANNSNYRKAPALSQYQTLVMVRS